MIRAAGDTRVRLQRLVDEASGEVRLYGHSSGRAAKARGIAQRFSTPYEKVLMRIGRLRQRESRVARYDDIRLEKDETTGNAKTLQWSRSVPAKDTLPGVYCLRTNHSAGDDATLWHTYTLPTDLEAGFRSLNSELGLRPV